VVRSCSQLGTVCLLAHPRFCIALPTNPPWLHSADPSVTHVLYPNGALCIPEDDPASQMRTLQTRWSTLEDVGEAAAWLLGVTGMGRATACRAPSF
jgi:hypothetical protein